MTLAMIASEMSPMVGAAARKLLAALPSVAEPIDYPAVKQAMDECVAALEALGIVGDGNRLLSSEFWNVAGHRLAPGWLQNRARMKPRGYAGDHEMLARIYAGEVCDDPVGRHFDRYFQEQAAPCAVRHRMRMIADWMAEGIRASDGPVKIVVVGSALAVEIRDGLLRLSPAERRRANVTLLDLDPAAIEFARRQLEPLLAADQLLASAENLFRMPDRPQMAALLEGADLLFCPGLFDYLDDAAAAAMLRTFWERLAPSGRMWVFQFAQHNPTRTYMEWIGNWYLNYRTLEEFKSLALAAGLPPNKTTFGAEPLGINFFLAAEKPRD